VTGPVSTSLVVFTRDLRVRDNPALVEACDRSDTVVPLFVDDDRLPIARSANRARFLDESLTDLDGSLRERGAGLVRRSGRWVDTVLQAATEFGVSDIHLAADVSGYAQQRERDLRRAAGARYEVVTHPGVTVVAPGSVTPAGGDAFKVFTPYHRRWLEAPWRRPLPPPDSIVMPEDVRRLTGPGDHPAHAASTEVVAGGETEGLRRLKAWTRRGLAGYPSAHDDLAADATSRISAHLHFGCLSPGEVASRLRERPGGAEFVRQLCWRDFFHQLLWSRPELSTTDYRSRDDRWNDDPDGFDAWRTGQTGYPLVDAAMNQLRREGFIHNRARMVVASFLTKDLYIDWRLGAAHFMEHLVDGDVANNQLNWQWTAGTGTDTNPHRILNPIRQSERFDPSGAYIRRYVPELAGVSAPGIHWPAEDVRQRCGYPAPIVDHGDAIAAYRAVVGPAAAPG
jgi:deoxyribodipyrimidine photo-lyase